MNSVLQRDTVLFATSPHSLLGRQLRLDAAAFQVDDIDDHTQSGSSVLVRGRVEPVETDVPSAEAQPHPRAPASDRYTYDWHLGPTRDVAYYPAERRSPERLRDYVVSRAGNVHEHLTLHARVSP